MRPETRLELRFEDEAVGASAGCNQFGGRYKIKEGVITADDGMTQMGCGKGSEEQDFRFANMLSDGARISFDPDGNLRLAGDGTTVVLEPDEE